MKKNLTCLAMLFALATLFIESNGTVPELCVREDCVHFQYTLTGLSYAAELARIQPDK